MILHRRLQLLIVGFCHVACVSTIPIPASPPLAGFFAGQWTGGTASLFRFRYCSDSSRCPHVAIAVLNGKGRPAAGSPIVPLLL